VSSGNNVELPGELCSLCPKLCRFACPVAGATADEGATPTAMFGGLQMADSEQLSWQAAADNLARCTGCAACTSPCEFDLDIPAMVHLGRALAWERGIAPDGARQFHGRCLEHGHPFGASLDRALEPFADDLDFQPKGRVLFWPGCRALAERPAQVAGTLDLLRRLGADHVSLPSRDDVPDCCGGALRSIGDRPGLQSNASGLHQFFNRQRTWVTASSTCLDTVSRSYPQEGLRINAELLHLAEYLLFFRARLASMGREAARRRTAARLPAISVRVHDACGLQRRLAKGPLVHEVVAVLCGQPAPSLAASPGRTHCCGAGDFFDCREPARAQAVGAWAARSQPAAPGSWIVTGDSDCEQALQAQYPNCEVMGLSTLILRWIDDEQAEVD
tara:strand:+ start:226 stop:1392 length:1167 start_codon:yes stop_codon:yes gene_type:complete